KINNLKNDAKIGKLIDDNYFRNKFYGIIPTEQWSDIQYFKARNGNLKLFLLDKYSGRVRTLNMKNNGAFENDLVPSKELKYYNIEINTSNEKNAGTSAKVFITLKGDNWESPEYHIDTISDDFERGSCTIQNIPVDKYFGEIKKVMIRHDNSNSKPGWYLQSVYITEGNSKNKWFARVYKWFAKTVGDKKIQREITLEKMPKKN
ncbi:MAG: PLAT/LH2 domain-containing protein, partial [Poseidonibacter sp.]